MNPVIAIVGRPNVGKSTLFNHLTRSRDALVADRPGLTRDRQYGIMRHRHLRFAIIDTGGLGDQRHDGADVADQIAAQAMQAVAEADVLFWLVDGRGGLSAGDEELARIFRKLDKPVYLLVNKLEGLDTASAMAEFYQFGFERLWPISAKRGNGISALLDDLSADLPAQTPAPEQANHGTTISVLGRPNVGKSTLINHILGEDRVLTFDEPGTTRDSIRVPFEKAGQRYTLIDTAGVRRRCKTGDSIEKFSVLQALDSIDQADVILFIIDAQQGATEQDNRLLGMARDSGRALIIAVNKWDRLTAEQKRWGRAQLNRKCRFVDYAKIHFISAITGHGVEALFKTIGRIKRSMQKKYSTADVTAMLYQFTETHPPPVVKGRRIKLRYAHSGGHNPVRIIIHGNQTEHLPNNYLRYLARSFRRQMKLIGVPVLIECKLRQGRQRA